LVLCKGLSYRELIHFGKYWFKHISDNQIQMYSDIFDMQSSGFVYITNLQSNLKCVGVGCRTISDSVLNSFGSFNSHSIALPLS